MKRINKKGFTLIELLAVIIILGVLLLIAVPSVSKYIQQSRQKTYATNLSKLVDAVSTEVNSYNAPYTFNTNEFLVVPVVCLELERGSSQKSPFSAYKADQTYIVVTRNGDNGFNYKVAALDETGFGTNLSAADDVKITSDATPEKINNLETAPSITIDSKSGKVTHKVTGTAGNYTCSVYTPTVTPTE